jgi:Protein of unknown function (DUF1524)
MTFAVRSTNGPPLICSEVARQMPPPGRTVAVTVTLSPRLTTDGLTLPEISQDDRGAASAGPAAASTATSDVPSTAPIVDKRSSDPLGTGSWLHGDGPMARRNRGGAAPRDVGGRKSGLVADLLRDCAMRWSPGSKIGSTDEQRGAQRGQDLGMGRMGRHRVRALLCVAATVAAAVGGTGCAAGVTSAAAPPTVERAVSSLDEAVTGSGSASASAAPASVPVPPVAPSNVTADRSQRSSTLATAVLQSLPVKGRAARTGYARGQFGSAWNDDTAVPGGHNGCDTRNDILRRDLRKVVIRSGSSGCVVASGELLDPYTGHLVAFLRGTESSAVQIDHVVALSDAWQTGGQRLSAAQRQQLANDPLELLAVDGASNQQKGDGDAASWLPSNKRYRCAYVARQLAVKRTYHLWVTAAEHEGMERILRTCPNQTVPHERNQPTIILARPAPTPIVSSRAVALVPSRSSAPRRGCTTTSTGSCIRGGQFCPKAKYGEPGFDADGTRYICTGDTTHPHWQTP